jgi:HAE1 family hydrophobic/amphiphilic exporter-1
VGWAEVAVRRPVTVLTAVLAVSVFGGLAVERLPSELLPDLTYPTLTVQTRYPDAAPTSVEQFVTKPVEEAVGVIPGVRELRSVSRASRSEVVLEFEWGGDMDLAALDVREKLGLAELPVEADSPRVLRYDPSLEPMLRLALRAKDPEHAEAGLDELHALAERWLEPRLEAVTGVAAVKLRGGLVAEVQVEADPEALAARDLTIGDLRQALAAEDVNLPGGTLRDWGSVYLVRTIHAWADLDAVRQTVVRENADGKVTVSDVAKVRRGSREREEVSLLDRREVLELALYREGSANLLDAANAVHTELEVLRKRLPPHLEVVVLSDPSRSIAQAVSDVWWAALLGGLLAVLVVYFFLRDLPSTLIVALTIPVSVIATFLPMLQAGVSLNVMSLGGLALGVGMLVDNAIVVLEAIDRRRRETPELGRRRAAAAGTRDVAGAVIAATLTTVSVFLPIVFVEGIAGQLFRDLAVTVCFSLLASLVASLTLIPALAGLDAQEVFAHATGYAWRRDSDPPPGSLRVGPLVLLPLGEGAVARLVGRILVPARVAVGVVGLALVLILSAAGWLFHGLTWPAARALEWLGEIYPRLLRRALSARAFLISATLLVFGATLATVPNLPTTLVPGLAQGELAFRLRLPEGTPLARTQEVLEQLSEPLLADARFARVFAVAGSLPSTASGRPTQGENLARLDVVLAPGVAESEGRSRVRQVLAAIPTLSAESVEPQALTLTAPVEVRLFAEDLAALATATAQVTSALAKLPQLTWLRQQSRGTRSCACASCVSAPRSLASAPRPWLTHCASRCEGRSWATSGKRRSGWMCDCERPPTTENAPLPSVSCAYVFLRARS